MKNLVKIDWNFNLTIRILNAVVNKNKNCFIKENNGLFSFTEDTKMVVFLKNEKGGTSIRLKESTMSPDEFDKYLFKFYNYLNK